MRKLLSKIRRACDEYHMIEADETICVAVSGGKDSMAMLAGMKGFSNFSPIPFKVHALCLDTGFENMDFGKLEEFCREIDVPLTIKKTQIAQIVFDTRKEKSPCALCAKMRRGALAEAVKELGASTLALGHHADDLIETFLLSLLYEGRISSFKPVTYLDRTGVKTIRPMINLREQEIIYIVNKNNIPVIKSACPVDGTTKREDVKNLVKQLSKQFPESDERMIHAVKTFLRDMDKNNL
ncbi:MAG: tRNA 2-thiocytidine biosynthesis protein TtcA [Anaerofustis stercorihominis]|nr:tRNA 2-thiocytidine biosynthesis protein TtcA [Anaerofustis stercorihominis]